MGHLDTLKTRLICSARNIPGRDSDIYAMIAYYWRGSKEGIKVFELEPGSKLEEDVKSLANIHGEDWIGRRLVYKRRMFTDPSFRNLWYSRFSEYVQPLLERYNLWQCFQMHYRRVKYM